ncbi:MAG: PDZ domain-containing protein [Pseudomonadota bacterium]
MSDVTEAIHYRLWPADPGAHRFRVLCTLAAPATEGQVVSLPDWIPGSYMIRDFARHVLWLRAHDAGSGQPVGVELLDKSAWRLAPAAGPVAIEYEVYAWDLSVRGAHLDDSHGFFNGTSVFLRVHGQEHAACTVELCPPDTISGRGLDWRLATTLPGLALDARGFGLYRAQGYEALIDHPVEMGDFQSVDFMAAGVSHRLVVTGRIDADLARVAADLAPVCAAQVAMFGGRAPFSRYLFLVMAVGEGYGGLEHRDSTALICRRDDLPAPGQGAPSPGYLEFLGLCSHEYFHAWNVKRIRPAAFAGLPLRSEAYSRLLWAFEGITSYYDDLMLLRAGRVDVPGYLHLLEKTLGRALRGRGHALQTLEDASFHTWTRYYKQDENAPNAITSYYTRGALVALLLDWRLRVAGSSLDVLMRLLWSRHGEPDKPVSEGREIEGLAAELAGESLDAFFNAALRGIGELPLAQGLASVGLRLLWPEAGAGMGVSVSSGALGEAVLRYVYDEGPAARAGLSAGDALIAVNGVRVDARGWEARLKRCRPGDALHLHVFRRDELREYQVTLVAQQAEQPVLEIDEQAPAECHARRRAWLAGA